MDKVRGHKGDFPDTFFSPETYTFQPVIIDEVSNGIHKLFHVMGGEFKLTKIFILYPESWVAYIYFSSEPCLMLQQILYLFTLSKPFSQ